MIDTSAIADTVRGLDKNAGLPDLFNYLLATDRAGLGRMSVETYDLGTGFGVYDVVWAMMKSDPRSARRAVAIFRLATAHSPGFGEKVTRASEEAHNRIIIIAQSMGVSFFAIGIDDALSVSDTSRSKVDTTYPPSHAGGNDADARRYDQNLTRDLELQYSAGRNNVDRIADETGGRSYWTTKKNYPGAVTGIANELSARYMLSFVPADKSVASPVHPIKVQVAGAAHVSAPRAYITQPQS